jgi:hypothetical protein
MSVEILTGMQVARIYLSVQFARPRKNTCPPFQMAKFQNYASLSVGI